MRAHLPIFAIVALLSGSTRAASQEIDVPHRLPVRETLASTGDGSSRVVAVLLSGDGGIGRVGRRVSERLADRGIPVVAVNSLRYFLRRKDPADAARDVERLMETYRNAWEKDRVLLVGYSLGADVLPFIVNRMSPASRERIETVALLAPERSVDFKFHLSYWWPWGRHRYPLSVADEAAKLRGTHVLCVQGVKDASSLCTTPVAENFTVAATPGGHHFGRRYGVVADVLADETLGPARD